MKIEKKNFFEFFLKLCVGAILLGLLLAKINWAEVWFYLQKISLDKIVIYVLVFLCGVTVSAYKWQLLAKFKGFQTTVWDCFVFYLTGAFINNFLPSFIGGDTYRAYQLGRKEKRFVEATASVVMDRLTGLLGVMLLSVFFAIANWQVVFQQRILLLIVLGTLLGLVAFVGFGFFAKTKFLQYFVKFIPHKVLDFFDVLRAYYAHKKTFFQALGLSIVFSSLGLAVLNYVIFWALGIQVGILNYLSVIFLISIVSAAPISIGNIGVQEWAYVTFFGFFGVSASAVIAVSIIIRILQMIVSFFALPMYLKSRVTHK